MSCCVEFNLGDSFMEAHNFFYSSVVPWSILSKKESIRIRYKKKKDKKQLKIDNMNINETEIENIQ